MLIEISRGHEIGLGIINILNKEKKLADKHLYACFVNYNAETGSQPGIVIKDAIGDKVVSIRTHRVSDELVVRFSNRDSLPAPLYEPIAVQPVEIFNSVNTEMLDKIVDYFLAT